MPFSYRFCGQEFTLENFEAQYHLSNNSVQKHYKNGERSEHLPDSNMWNSDQFKKYLLRKGKRQMGQSIQECTKYNLWKTAFKKFQIF